ncbi:MFS transporter [Gimesia aquarii]|uniref:Putative sulfoacetate transporter SauU n=1 Tax=Gimesia aquarii TaxID=2527964 RepID=A0A517X113_9PLAN|nr:MFS transporter [Gimesia aquarii]QDU11189.1 putative sulfoacetate transporter SauU [Gimesia aquarii]
MSSTEPPTSYVRYRVIFACMLMAILLYLDRFCISFAEVFIKDELGLSDKQIAIILGSFFVSYAFCQVPSGWLSDRFGARTMLTLYILMWSLFTALTGFVTGFIMLLLFRLGFGVGQAGAYPTSANIVSKWMPLSARGIASSMVAVGGRLGGALAPILTAFLIVLFVPISQSSELTTGDLMKPQQFAVKFMENLNKKQEFETTIYDHLTPESKEYLKAVASEKETETGTAVEADFLVNLNSILQKDTLYHSSDFEDLKLNQQAEQLLNITPGEMNVEERSRLNRLLLEARYYTEFRKVQGKGWRPVMVVYGVFGIVIAGFFWWTIRDYPRMHPSCSEQELEAIEFGRNEEDKDHTKEIGGIPLKAIVENRSLWMLSLSQFCTNIGWLFLVTWLPRYLDETYQVPLKERGTMITVALAVGWFGTLSGGKATDWLRNRISLRWSRVLPIVVSRFTAMAAYILLCFLDVSPWVAVALFSVVAFSTDFGSPAMWAFNQDIGGKHVGSVLGWGNMWGNLGAAIAPYLMIWVIGEDDHYWSMAFVTCAVAFFIAGVASLGVDTAQTLIVEEEPEGELAST